jgi:hypothetical protein
MPIFLSHSKDDEEKIIAPIDELIGKAGITSIIHMPLEGVRDLDKIANEIYNSEALFAIITPNVIRKIHTVTWISTEIALAYAYGKPICLFEDMETAQKMANLRGEYKDFPVLHVDDYILISDFKQFERKRLIFPEDIVTEMLREHENHPDKRTIQEMAQWYGRPARDLGIKARNVINTGWK